MLKIKGMKQGLAIGYKSIHEMLEHQGYRQAGWGAVDGRTLEEFLDGIQRFKTWVDSQRCSDCEILIIPEEIAINGELKGPNYNPRGHLLYLKVRD